MSSGLFVLFAAAAAFGFSTHTSQPRETAYVPKSSVPNVHSRSAVSSLIPPRTARLANARRAHVVADTSEDIYLPSAQIPFMAPDGLVSCSIKVIGIGGGGGNTVNRMLETVDARNAQVDFFVVNTDQQALDCALTDNRNRIQIGPRTSRGLGAGGLPHVGASAATESREALEKVVQGVDMVFVTAGMGGGTGSGAAPVVAEIAKAAGCLTVGIVTKPFHFEGRKRMNQAQLAIEELKANVDILIVVSNDKLLEIVPEGIPLQEAFVMADEILRQGIVGISEIITRPGLINVDFADVRSVMQDAGLALMGIGRGAGNTRASDAAMAAITSPLLDFPIKRAKGIVFTITGNSRMSLHEVNEIAEIISDVVDEDANVIFGALVDEDMGEEISVTVVATDFQNPEGEEKPRSSFQGYRTPGIDNSYRAVPNNRAPPSTAARAQPKASMSGSSMPPKSFTPPPVLKPLEPLPPLHNRHNENSLVNSELDPTRYGRLWKKFGLM